MNVNVKIGLTITLLSVLTVSAVCWNLIERSELAAHRQEIMKLRMDSMQNRMDSLSFKLEAITND